MKGGGKMRMGRARRWSLGAIAALVVSGSLPAQAGLWDQWLQSQLTSEPWGEIEAMVSPSGGSIAYTARFAGGVMDIYTVNADGTNPAYLTTGGTGATASFSQDGTAVLYSNAADLWRINVDRTLNQLLWTAPGGQAMPNQLPDGRIVYQAWGGPPLSIWIANGDGSGQQQLPTVADAQQPRVSPDGRHIVYMTQNVVGTPIDIYTYDLILGTERRLTFETAQQGDPCFSPDGNWVIYQSKEDGGSYFDLWVLSFANPAERHQLNNDTADSTQPQFDPLGGRIIYSRGTWGSATSFDLWQLTAVPEPATLSLLALGGLGLLRRRHRR